MILSLSGYSQQEVELADTLGPELLITHSKSPISLKSSYKPSITISKQEIDAHALDDVSSLLDQQVGISVNGAFSNPGKDKSLYVQGAGGAYTLVLVDGLPVTDPSGIGGSFDLRNFSLSQIERIEVIKGGQSVLFGSDAVAGVVNLITTQSKGSDFSAVINSSIGSYGHKNVRAGVDMPIAKHLKFHIDGSYASSNGISEALDLARVGFDRDGYSRKTLNTSLHWKPHKRINFTPFFRLSSFDGDYDGGAFTDAADSFKADLLQTGFTSSYKSGNNQINLSYIYNGTDRFFDSALFGASAFNGRFHHLDIYSNLKIDEQNTLTIGLNAQEHITQDLGANQSSSLISPYASWLLQPDERTNIEIGLRYNKHDTFGSNVNTSIGGSHWVSSNIKLFTYWATSFKAPNLFQLYGQFGANPDLNPQIGRSFNFGVVLKELGVFGTLEASVFERNIKQLILYDFNSGYQNIAKQNDRGVELSVVKKYVHMSYDFSYTYLVGEQENSINTKQVSNLYKRPKHQIDGSVTFYYAQKNRLKFNLRYVGSRNDLYFDNATFLNEAVVLDKYVIGNLYLDYFLSGAKIKFFGEVRNLLDTQFQEVAGFSTMGRNIIIGFSVRLD